MESEQNQPQQPAQPAPQPQQPEVTFPAGSEKGKSKFPKWIIAVVGVVIILIAGGMFLLQSPAGEGTAPSPTPDNSLNSFGTPAPTSTPRPTTEPEPVDKAEVKIEILNGTGVPGEAGLLRDELQDADFVEITTANADDQKETKTTVTFDKDLPSDIVDEITDILNDMYKKVTTKKASLSSVDVRVLTGPRSGVTATPKATEEPSASESPSPSPSPSSNPTE